ncbi:MAG: hypothetical protein JOY71_26560 [Acetobacteraceae bacterium]|nr:hypothetical protein [Acetobacteraceae bacterium]MBV8591233.1 hypothetical protein [Acetobacteraceae bacterium]
MSSSTSSSEWRRFFRLTVTVAFAASALLYLFIVTIDPYDILPFSPPFPRSPVDSNARFAFPALARSGRFDSAIIGTSTSRLLRPATLNAEFGARFVNLSMNAATAYEQVRILQVFARHHPNARTVLIGVDLQWCGRGEPEKYTGRPMPEWMYDDPWLRGYREMFNLNVAEKAGQAFGVLTGLNPEHYGRDGYAPFVPDERVYDPARVAVHLREAASLTWPDDGTDPRSWRLAALDRLGPALDLLPPETRKIVFFVPFNHVFQPKAGPGHALWAECKRRVTQIVSTRPNAAAVDFMIPSPITEDDNNYWDAIHYRVGVAERLAHDLGAASRGEPSEDYALLRPEAVSTARR